MKVFYIRCSTEEQNEARQVKAAADVGAEKVFIDKASGANSNRKELKEMLSFVRAGDTVIVESISRLARSTKDFLNIIEELTQKGVKFISQKESIDTGTPQGKFMLTVFSAMAELERENILQRQKEGIEIAKAQGKYKGRKPIAVDERLFKAVCGEWIEGKITAREAQRRLNLTPNTFYRKAKQAGYSR